MTSQIESVLDGDLNLGLELEPPQTLPSDN